MKKFLKNTRTFFAGFMALMMIMTLLPMTALADPVDGEGEQLDNNNVQQGNPEGGENNNDRRQFSKDNVVFEIIDQTNAEVLYKLDDGDWNFVDADKSQEQFAGNVNFNEASLEDVTSISVKVNLNDQDFDDFDDPDTHIGNNNFHVRENGAEIAEKSTYHLENRGIASENGFSFEYTADRATEFIIELRFSSNNGGGDNGGNQSNGNVRFNISNQDSTVIKYSLDGTNWYLVDADKEQNPDNVNFSEANLAYTTKIYVKVELGENMKFDDYVEEEGKTRSYLLVEEGGQPTDATQYGIEEALASEGGFSFDYNPADNQKLYTVVLSFMQSNGGNPQIEEKPTIVLHGETDIVLVDDGEEVNKVDGITLSYDNGMPVLTLNGCNRSGDSLEITDTANVRICVLGTNSLYGICLGERVKLEVDVATFQQNDPSAAAIGTLKIGNDAIHGGGMGSEINITGDVILDLTTDGDAFTSFEKVRLTNYEFHSREKTNNIIFAKGYGFKGVGRVEIYSTKAEFAVEGALTDEMIPVVVCQEGQIKVLGSPEQADFRSRYYESYPGDGGPADNIGHDLESKDNMTEVNIFDENMSEAARASFKKTEGDAFVLTSLDPILYSISYQVDKEYFDEHPELGDPFQGEVFMNGFKKGFWIQNGTGGKFEAWIAAGETVNVTILPKPGYQYIKNTLNINGATIDTEPGEDKGTYSFVSGPNAGHICAGFIKTEDVVKISSKAGVKDAGILDAAEGAVETGNFELEVGSATPSDEDKAKIETAADYADASYINLDLKLNEYVVKNYDPDASEQEAWETPLTDLKGKNVTIGVELPDDVAVGEDKVVKVVRLHDDVAEVIDSNVIELEVAEGEEAGKKMSVLTFDTDKFSTYAIAYTSKYVITQGDDQTVTINEGDEYVIFKCNGSLSKFVKPLMDGQEMPAGSYEVYEGSTILKIKRTYLDTLAKGSHSLTFVYTDGEVTAHFTLQTKPSGNDNNNSNSNSSNDSNTATLVPVKDSVPKTGERYRMLFVLLFISGAAVLGMGFSIKALRNKE